MLAIRGAGFISPKLVRSKMALDFVYTLYLILKKNKSTDNISASEAKRIVQKWYVLAVLINSGEVHHIFPKAYLRKYGFEKNRYNQLGNYVYIDAD